MPVPTPSALEPANLLIRGVNWLGDAVMTTPALKRLRERFPNSSISLLTAAGLSDLWLDHPGIDRVITFEPGESIWSLAQRLRKEQFDLALVLPNSFRSALQVWLAGIPNRLGYAGNCRSGLLSRPVMYPKDRVRLRRRGLQEIKRLTSTADHPSASRDGSRYAHQMQDYLELIAALGANPSPLAPQLHLSAGESETATADCLMPALSGTDWKHPTPLWLGINPSAAYGPAKCWPLANFAAVAREICAQIPNAVWLSFGAQDQRETCQRIVESAGVQAVNLAGRTSLRQLMALLNKCQALLTNDSGPMHVAAALSVPVVVPFGSTSPELTGPGLPGDSRHSILRGYAPCAPCFRRTCPIDFRCMTGIPPERAVKALLQILQGPQ